MIKIVVAGALSVLSIPGVAQDSEAKKPDLRAIFDALEVENSKKAYSMAVQAMDSNALSDDSRAKLLGLRITALAQLFANSKITFKELRSRTKLIPLGPILQVGHRFREAGGLNLLTSQKESPSALFLAESNKNGTYIYVMYTIKLNPEVPFNPVEGEVYFVSGKLTSLECHPHGRGSYVFRATIDQATLHTK